MGQINEKCSLSIDLPKSIESLDSRNVISLNEVPSEMNPNFHYSYPVDFDIDLYNVNDFNFNRNFPIDNSFDINENEENAFISQKNNLIINIGNESENNNSSTKETPFISQRTISKNTSNKQNKHLGRKKKEETANQPDGSSHDKYKEDNISVKIQRHYLNFIIELLNCIFHYFNYNIKLYKLERKFKINIKKKKVEKNVKSLNEKTIGDIISNTISEKYKTINDKSKANKNICEEVKNNSILKKILSENYLVFFKKFYYNSYSYVNLKDYGLDKDIIFTKDVKNFKHLLKENEKNGDQYIMSIKKHVLKNYLPGSIFIVNY